VQQQSERRLLVVYEKAEHEEELRDARDVRPPLWSPTPCVHWLTTAQDLETALEQHRTAALQYVAVSERHAQELDSKVRPSSRSGNPGWLILCAGTGG
jgi:hypothetical protein